MASVFGESKLSVNSVNARNGVIAGFLDGLGDKHAKITPEENCMLIRFLDNKRNSADQSLCLKVWPMEPSAQPKKDEVPLAEGKEKKMFAKALFTVGVNAEFHVRDDVPNMDKLIDVLKSCMTSDQFASVSAFAGEFYMVAIEISAIRNNVPIGILVNAASDTASLSLETEILFGTKKDNTKTFTGLNGGNNVLEVDGWSKCSIHAIFDYVNQVAHVYSMEADMCGAVKF
jgi:hypothetical protein